MEILIKLLVLSLSLGVVLRMNVFSSVYIYPSDIVVCVLFVAFIIQVIRSRMDILKLPLLKEWLIFIVFGFVSLILSSYQLNLEQFITSLLYGVRILLYSIPVFVILSLKIGNLKKYLLISGSGFVILGLIQYVFYNDLRNLYYLQWDEHIYRLFSSFLDPNFTGAFLVLILLLYLSQVYQSKTKKIAFFSLILITLLSILLTYSRSTFIMLFIALVVFFTIINKKKFIFIAVLLIALLYLFIPKDFKIENMNLLRTESIRGRQGSFSNAFYVFQKSPVFGVGFNSYRYVQKRYGLLDTKFEVTHSGAGVSNSYLFVLATTGIIGLGIFIYFWWKVIKLVMLQGKKDIYFKALVLSSIAGVGVHSLFENTIFYPFIMIWIFILVGMVASKRS